MAGAWLPNAVFTAALLMLGFRQASAERRTPNNEPRTPNTEPGTELEHEPSTENREA